MQLEVSDGVAAVAFGDTLLAIWQAPASQSRCAWLAQRLERLASEMKDGILVWYVILPSSSPPDAATRAQIQRDFARLGTRLKRFVVVPVGNSLWFNLTRAIMRGLLLVSGHSRRYCVVSSVAEALERLQAASGPRTPSRPQLLGALRALSTALGVEPPEAASSVWVERSSA
jgi:hypothetical protein